MKDWLLLGARAAVTSLALYPWAAVGASLFERSNPFSAAMMTAWIVLASWITRRLHRRPRRLLTHLLIHTLGAGYGFLVWLSYERGIPLTWPNGHWWAELNLGSSPAASVTELFWFIWWACLWMRGWQLTHQLRDAHAASSEFEVGLMGWALVLLLGIGTGASTAGLVPALFTYFLAGLAVLALTGSDRLGRRMEGLSFSATGEPAPGTGRSSLASSSSSPSPSAAASPSGRERGASLGGGSSTGDSAPTGMPTWLVVLLLVMTGGLGYTVLATIFGFSAAIGSGLDEIAGWLSPWVTAFLTWLLRRPGFEAPAAETAPPPEPVSDLGLALGEQTTPLWLQIGIWVLLALVGIVVLCILGYGLYRLWQRLLTRTPGSASSKADGDAARLWRLLRAVVRLLWRRWRRRWRRWKAFARGGWSAVGETVRPRSVRALYRGLLRWGWLIGAPRSAHETPYEYAARLASLLPAEAARFVQQLTTDYVACRYSGRANDRIAPQLGRGYRRLFHPFVLGHGLLANLRQRRFQRGLDADRFRDTSAGSNVRLFASEQEDRPRQGVS